MKAASNEAELQALMAVVKAKDDGLIKRRNILKMDKKVNECVRKYLSSNHGSTFRTTLAEKLTRSQRRHLPKPFTEPEEPPVQGVSMLDPLAITRDQLRWSKLPDDIRDEALSRMHSFLLLKSDDVPIGAMPISPFPLIFDTLTENIEQAAHCTTK